MGNNQSSESKKIYKIVAKTENSSRFRYYLDDYVTYEDGSYDWIEFEKNSTDTKVLKFLDFVMTGGESDYEIFNGSFNVGDYIKFGAAMTRSRNSDFKFTHSSAWLVGGTTGSRSNTVLHSEYGLADLEGMQQERQAYIASIEQQSRHANNHAWTKQNSWDMPPGWK